MIYIYQHGGQHNEISFFQFSLENKRYKHWKYQIKKMRYDFGISKV